jgi:hypothetical protein
MTPERQAVGNVERQYKADVGAIVDTRMEQPAEIIQVMFKVVG